MTTKDKDFSADKRNKKNSGDSVPFIDAVEAWFWFIQAQDARNDGARYTAGMSLTPRPCEPADILKILDRLYRNRMLLRDHLLVLRHYGRRQFAPNPKHVKEAVAYKLWIQAMERIEPVLVRKGIVKEKKFFDQKPSSSWVKQASVFESAMKEQSL